ncbi:uncharacterized protein LOC123523370 [Mercenaria mercenaria]|uniref:uncharacterized protein LOC123523370 n=1 Tax=Mercenaria mercenaria TaxID=6596 RepID=UPI00234F0BBE|nr:uncharacterized protein LOC123523370 [Mercenaria mercenaria]
MLLLWTIVSMCTRFVYILDLKVMRRFIWTAVVLACMVCCDVICTTVNDWHFSGPNIALHKSATQKPGTYKDNRLGYSYPASLAVDGNDDNDFAHKSCSLTTGTLIHEPSQHIAQWLVELGGNFSITGIIVVNRKDLKVRLKDFVVFGYSKTFCSNTDDWCQIYNDTNLNMYMRDEIYILDDSKQAYSKIAINLPKHSGDPDNGFSYLTLCEVKIYAAQQPGCRIKGQFGKSDIYNNTGTIVNGLYTAGTVIQTSCEEGFLISGSAFSKCLSSGNWTTNTAKCIVSEESVSEGERKALVIGCFFVAAVLIIIVTSALAIILCCRKRRRQRNERESNLYTDLSCERRTLESEYSNTYELQLPNGLNSAGRASSHEAESCSAAEKEGPFYCNITLK